MKRLLFVLLLISCPLYADDRESSLRLPKSDVHYRETSSYIEDVPDADYKHASAEAYERFRDIKYSIRIIWGVYTLHPGTEASWNMLNYSNEKKQEYQELYKKFNPVDFNAEQWMADFDRWGMQCFAFICKHHDGFALWDTKTRVKRRFNFLTQQFEDCNLAYSIMDTPFKRDIVKELTDAAAKHNTNVKEDYRKIKVDLYFSHPDWYDADFRPYNYHPLATPDIIEHPKNYYNAHGTDSRKKILTPEKTAEEKARFVTRHREQIHELLTNYGHVDMMCFDQWFGKDCWQETKETVKAARQWSPETMFRARGIGNYGDYYQPEAFVPKEQETSGMPWMSICLLGKSFSYDPVGEHYKGTGWVIHNLMDCVAKGGSFMVCLGPDARGNFHPKAKEQLEEVGKWLKVNGKGIYETIPCNTWTKDNWYFTRAKDKTAYFAFTEKWFGKDVSDGIVIIPQITPAEKSEIRCFGYDKPLKWTKVREGIKVEIPDDFKLPCKYAVGI